MREVTLRLRDLKVAYGNHRALDISELSLTGGVIALLGHNGAGKSTLIKTILGLLPHSPQALRIVDAVTGQSLTHFDMAFCPESGSVFEDITVEDYIRLWCRLRHRDGTYFKKEGARYMETLEIGPLLPRRGRELSKGQRRRVQTAIGFLTKPRLFLFDEPFDGLDVQKTQELAEIIQQASSDMNFIISSHRMDVMERLADHALVLQGGQIAAHGTIDETCQTLAGTSAVITGASQPLSLCEQLRAHMPQALITHLGAQIAITAPTLDEQLLAELVRDADRNGAMITLGRASLTDAMSYHLRELAG